MSDVVLPGWAKSYNNPQALIERIMRYFHRKSRPVYLGEISIETGLSLKKTEELLQCFVEAQLIKPATSETLKKLGSDESSVVFVLSGSSDLKFAYLE